MNFRIKITRKLLIRLALFLGILATAMVLDIYFDNHSVEIKTTEDKPNQTDHEFAAVYILGQTSNVATKISIQKFSDRKFLEQHDKLLQKYHESKNFREYQAEGKELNSIPLFINTHFLLFRHYYFAAPDDEFPLS